MTEPSAAERAAAKPARHVDRRRMGPGAERGPDGLILPDMPTAVEVERRMVRCDDELSTLVEDMWTISEQRAMAEAAWKEHRDRVIVDIANSGDKGAKDIREAIAKERVSREGTPGEDLYRTFLIMEAAEESTKRQLGAVQSRLSGLQSIRRGIGAIT